MKGQFPLLILYGLVTLATSQVEVDQFVNVNRGQEVTLRCVYTGSQTPGSITWWKVNGDSLMRIAIALPSSYRINNSTFYGRLNFTNYTSELRNGSIRIEDLRLGDEGDFTCSFATLDDETQATISLTVNVNPFPFRDVCKLQGEVPFTTESWNVQAAPPNVSLELNPSQLVDSMGLVTVATCVAQEGKPAASITWSGLHQGSSSETTEVEPDGTVTVKSRYQMEPKYESHGRTLTCRVEHPAFEFPVNLSTTLDIHFPPNVSLELNPSQLVEGMGLVTVAMCVAREGHPAAFITWSGLHQGSSSETTETEPDGKVTVRSEYRMEPTKESQGRTLTCRVEHPALEPPLVELSTTLDIHYKPSVSIAGYDGNWYVDKEAASLTCEADANPYITHYLWDRQDGFLPDGTVVSGNSLSFERPLVESDSGSFSCRANNSVGWGEAVVIITIRPGTTMAATTTATTTTTSTTPTTTTSTATTTTTSTTPTTTTSTATTTTTSTTPTTTTSTMPVAATTPGGGDNGGDDGGVEPWVIAVAVIVPLLVLAVVAGSVFFFCLKKKGIQETSTRRRGRDAPEGSAHRPSQQQQQHQQQDDHHQYEYIDGKFPSHNLKLQQPPPGSAAFYNAHAEITSNWNNHREHLDEKNPNSTESNPQNQEDIHYQPLKPSTEKTYDKLNHPTYENV